MIKGKHVTSTETKLVRICYCDFCGMDLSKQRTRTYEDNFAQVSVTAGELFPGSDSDQRECTYVDVCATCFRTKVVPAVEALGVTFHTRSADAYDHCDEIEGESK